MLYQQFGSMLLGFSGVMKCSHCGNEKPMQVRQDFVKQSVFLIPLPTANNRIFMFCSVCEKENALIKGKPLFSGQDKIDQVVRILDDGKEYTKYWVNQLEHKEREAAFKRLNSLKAYELVRYLGS
jgi:hypothetical protein